MKTKKKATNRYKFQSFAQRISKINIDVFTQTGEKFHGIPENEKDTFFRETLEKLGEMNCSLDFISLYKELKPYVRTFNLLVYHKEKIVALLKQYLALDGSYATKACLELLATLSRDLSQDFYPIFNEVFGVLIQLMKRKDAELVEDTFVCLAYIFKCTWRYMVNEIDNIFRNFKCLLSDNQEHIQSFAAESFAFLIQKSKKRKKVVEGLLVAASNDSTLAVGVGCLIYQTIKGVKNQFILSTKELLLICLKTFLLSNIDKDQVFIVLQTTWLSSLKHTTPENSVILFDSIYESIEKCSGENDGLDRPWSYYYKLLNVGVTHKRGHYVNDQDKLFEILERQFSLETLAPDDISSLMDLLKSSIEISNLKINDSNLTKLFIKFLDYSRIPIIEKFDFCRTLFTWRKFEEDLKDPVLEYICKCLLSDEYNEQKNTILQFMVDLIYKDRKLDEPFSLYIDETSLLWFPVNNEKQVIIENLLLDEIDVGLLDGNVEQLWVIVTCVCYCKFSAVEKVIKKVSDIIQHGLQMSHDMLEEETLCSLAHCIKTILMLENNADRILEIIPWEKMMSFIKIFPTNEHVLQAFEAYCCSLGEQLKQFKDDWISDLYNLLKSNINSPHKLSCLLTLRLFKYFDDNPCDLNTELDVFRNCIDALNTEVSLHTYQEKLMLMRMVTWNSEMKELHHDAALRFLISNLYINFSLMWEPVYELIASYASNDNQLFWEIWMEMLNMAADICVNPNPSKPSSITSSGTFSKCFTSISKMKDEVRVDYKNFRVLLWNTMCKFPGVIEKKAKQIIPLYQRFMREEYSLIDEMIAKKQDLSIKHETELIKKDKKLSKGKPEFQALCAHLRVFALFKKPKKLEKEFHLYQGYLDFLTSKDNEIQCLAIDCLMTYSHPYMTPYKQNFNALMNDTRFRDELMFFSASNDEETEGIINQDHLKQLMPVLIRLLYGKLQRRAGLGASGKASSSARRNIIMQFLINCSEEQITTFFDLILEPFNSLKDVSFNSSSVDISSIVPLRKQSGFLNMFSTVLTRLSKKVLTYLPQLCDTLLKVLWMCSEIIKQKERVHASYITRVKDIRRLGLSQLNDLFERKDETFTYRDSISDIFIVGVWPQLSGIITESSQCATPLLKMFVTWSKHSEYHFLLSVSDKDGISPINSLFALLKQKSLSGTVENLIMTIVMNLLSLQDKEIGEDEQGKEHCQLIKPFVTDILDHISTKILVKTKDSKKKQMMKKVIPNIQFSVLSELSRLVSDPEQSSAIVGILFPLLQCIGSEATQLHIITTIDNLLPFIECTQRYLHIVPSLFSMVQTRKPRQVLCEVYVKMTQGKDNLELIGDLVHRLNAWDLKHLDEPDYDKRLEAFRCMNERIKSNHWDSDQILPVLHNVLFFLLTTEDLSIRNAASSSVENIIQAVKEKSELFSDVVLKALFPVVKGGLKSKREEVRVEFISLLGLMVKTFVNHHQFTDMGNLCSDDPETDFFKNFNHIQVHRKIRAIRQLRSLCDEGKLSVSNMFFIVLPMITPFIFTKLAASKDHNLLSETISAVGSVMNQLPWSKYSHILKNYLKILQKDLKNQKNILRLLMAVLNNFHFDLSPLDAKNDADIAKPYNKDEGMEQTNDTDSSKLDTKGGKDEDMGTNNDTDIPKPDIIEEGSNTEMDSNISKTDTNDEKDDDSALKPDAEDEGTEPSKIELCSEKQTDPEVIEAKETQADAIRSEDDKVKAIQVGGISGEAKEDTEAMEKYTEPDKEDNSEDSIGKHKAVEMELTDMSGKETTEMEEDVGSNTKESPIKEECNDLSDIQVSSQVEKVMESLVEKTIQDDEKNVKRVVTNVSFEGKTDNKAMTIDDIVGIMTAEVNEILDKSDDGNHVENDDREEQMDEGYNSDKGDKEEDEEEAEDIVENEETQTDEVCDGVDDDNDDDGSDVDEECGVDGEKEEEIVKNVTSFETLKRIYSALTDFIIPQLNKFLQKKNPYDSSKSNYKEVDDQDLLKLPMELALAQLLHKLPGGILHLNLPGVLLRVSQSLRSHSKEVREMARDTMKKISYSLGASYLSLALKEMKSILQHGYQRHVLGYTLHSVLDNMKEILNAGDLDACVQDIMEVVVEELVGIVGEEKEVSAIANKLFEAQHRKSNATSEITAKYVSSEFIGKVITPLKEVLDTSQTHTVIHKIEESLFHIANGLQSNKGMQDSDMLIFIYGVLSDAMNMMSDKQNEGNISKGDGQEDYHLVAAKPIRGGVAPRASDKTNNHVLITFGLHLLNSCLKRQRFVVSDTNHIKMLDPIIPSIMTNITSPHNKIVTLALKCLCTLLKFHLPSTKSYFPMLGRNLFKIMKTFTQAGASKGKDVELISNSFKVMTILIREHSDFPVTEKQFKILLSLVEEDVHTSSRQVVALPLLKAILSRKVKITLVNDIIMKISDLSIRDLDAAVQLQCRKIVLQFLLDYPVGKKLVDHFDFYISHLSYEEEGGRISSLEMLTLIFNNIPQRLLLAYAAYMFIPLVMMLVNDDSATCRKLCGCTIKVLIQMLDVNSRDEMFRIVKKFNSNENISLRHVSIQLFGLFAEVEKETFGRHMTDILPLFIEMLQSYSETKDDEDDKSDDKLLYNSINCLVKIFNESGVLNNNETYFKQFGHICNLCKNHLLHPHAWIRLAVSQLFSLYFSSFSPDDWIMKTSTLDNVLKLDPRNIKDLCFSFFAQLKDSNLSKEIGEQATKNLVFLFRMVKLLDPKTCAKTVENDNRDAEGEGEEADDEGTVSSKQWKPTTIKLFIRKLCQLAAFEAANNPKETKKRICVLRLLASLSLCLGEDYLKDYLLDILPSIHRELSSSADEGSSIYTLAQEVLELIQGIVKKDVFADAYAKMQKYRLDKRETKKRKLLTEAVTNPALLARRKQKKNLAKRDQRKRKLNEKKPLMKFKKIRYNNDDNS